MKSVFRSEGLGINQKVLKTDQEKIAFEGAFTNEISKKELQSAQALKEEGLLW